MTTPLAGDGKKDSDRLHVLVADDNRDQAESMGRLLTLWGYSVQVVFDGLEALEAAQAHAPDVALLDLGLPGMDGYQVALHLRRQPELKEMIIIAVTGYQWKDADLRSKEYGFDLHLVKPVDPDRLQTLLAKLTPRDRHRTDPPCG
jgi:CheY-like chemotaxis protein